MLKGKKTLLFPESDVWFDRGWKSVIDPDTVV